MNREETRKAAEVMLHYANGGEVQRTTRKQPEHWLDMTDYNYPNGPQWDWRSAVYRIKPQPVEVTAWAAVNKDSGGTWQVFQQKKHADQCVGCSSFLRIVELKGTYTCDT